MATERLSMRQTRQILRQKWSLGRTHREVAQSLGISCGAVGTTVLRARAAGLAWAQVEALDDEALHARVYGPPTPPTRHRPLPDCAYLHAERRKPGVTLELLHLEYLEQHPAGYRYTQFCEVYRRWLKRPGSRCARSIMAARSCSSTTPGRSRRSSTPPPARWSRSSCSSPSSARPTTPTPKPRARSRSPTGLRAISAPSTTLAASRAPSSPIS